LFDLYWSNVSLDWEVVDGAHIGGREAKYGSISHISSNNILGLSLSRY